MQRTLKITLGVPFHTVSLHVNLKVDGMEVGGYEGLVVIVLDLI